MRQKYKISIIGTGSLGTALSSLLLTNGHEIGIYEKNKTSLERFKQTIKSPAVKIFSDMATCLCFGDIIIPCLPSSSLPKFYHYISDLKPTQKIISISKGLYPNTLKTISQHLLNFNYDLSNFMVFSGPTFAQEIINQYPTISTISSPNYQNKKIAQAIFCNQYFNIEFNRHVTTTEYNGILKNCYAITFGIISHLGFGMNTKSAAIIKIITELQPLYRKLKLHRQDLYSISFLGDLIATGLNPNSRNFQAGYKLSKNKNITTEGFKNIKSILKITQNNQTVLPILHQTDQIINKKIKPESLIKYLI
ncbi:MAG: NAD(P)-binding domain-containing protein [Patescibacteria group bacterium]